MTHEGVATDSDEELLQRLFTSDNKINSLGGNALTLVTEKTTHDYTKRAVGAVALQESQGKVVDVPNPDLELPASQNAIEFLQKIFNNDERIGELTEAQAYAAIEVLIDIYQNIEGAYISERKVEITMQRLILHFNGLKGGEIAAVDDIAKTASGILLNRTKVKNLIQNDYSHDHLKTILGIILSTPASTSISQQAAALLESKRQGATTPEASKQKTQIPKKSGIPQDEPLNSGPRLTPEAIQEFMGLSPDEDLPWQEFALCAQTDPESFFPEKGGSTRAAKDICKKCEVRIECLDYALKQDERFGIWGGLSERERRRLKKKPK